uniref:Eukaryotic translation initiation factor 3 subunit J n=1 Tax=Cacopsylla melanoneura TaxID=428564 RepID=A0A8D8RN59_9HEMI
MGDWESNYTPTVNKWEGEDEDDDVKDSWDADDAEEEEKKPVEPTKPGAKKPKNKLEEKIAEREAKAKLERELLQKRLTENPITKEMTPEEKLAEKLRRQKLVEDSDLENTKELLGVTDISSIDAMDPETKSEFEKFESTLSKKITFYAKSEHFASLVEDLTRNLCVHCKYNHTLVEHLTRNLCVHLPSADIRKIKMGLDNMYIEKSKMEKGDKPKKGGKGKGKAKLRLEGDGAMLDEYAAYSIDDQLDDFI